MSFPPSDLFGKRLSYRGGVVKPRELALELVRLIASGVADPSFVRSAVVGVEEVAEYDRRFNGHEKMRFYIRFPRIG